MIRLLLLAAGAWVAYRVVEENGLNRQGVLLPAPTRSPKAARRSPARRKS